MGLTMAMILFAAKSMNSKQLETVLKSRLQASQNEILVILTQEKQKVLQAMGDFRITSALISGLKTRNRVLVLAETKKLFVQAQNQNIDILTISDDKGVIVARGHLPEAYGDKKGSLPLYKQALGGKYAADYEKGKAGFAIRGAAPIFDYQGRVIGTIMIGRKISNQWISQVRGKTGVEISIFEGSTKRIATTLKDSSKSVMEAWSGKYSSISYPFKGQDGKILGMLSVVIPREEIVEAQRQNNYYLTLIAILVSVIAGGVGYILSLQIVKPINRLAYTTEQFALGNIWIDISHDSKDEVGRLYRSFALMAESIRELAQVVERSLTGDWTGEVRVKSEKDLLSKNINKMIKGLFSSILEKERLLLLTVKALVAALESKDRYTHNHSLGVAKIAERIIEKMELSEKEKFKIRFAALLHDVGKIGIPDRVLNKKGQLHEEEWLIMQKHPAIGAKIIGHIPGLKEIGEIVLCHHARWDGKGYPFPLSGEDIPLGARIIAIADTFQAMTSNRPYRKSFPLEAAIREIESCSGTQFDPQIVKSFLDIQWSIEAKREKPL